MGLTNNNTMETRTGLTVPVGAYMSIGTEVLETRVNGGIYSLEFSNVVWKDKAMRDAGSRAIQHNSHHITLTSDQLGTSVYTLAYDYLRTIYPNTADI